MAAAQTEESADVVQIDWDEMVRVGPDRLAGRYLRRFWHPVIRSQDLPAGRAIPVRLLGQDFTLYRGESGAPPSPR